MPSLPVVRPPFSFVVAASAVLLASGAPAEPVKSEPAARFIDSIGVNVHPYENYERHHEVLQKKLGELGVRHVRDGTTPKSFKLAMSFFKTHGIKTTFITGRRVGGEKEWSSPLRPEGILDELNELRDQALAATAAIEGPNEYDLHSDKRDPDWPATLRNYQRLVFTHANEDPALRPLPVIGPSLTSEEAYRKVGDLDAWLDMACVHHYPGTRHPGTSGWGENGYGSMDWTMKLLVARQSPSGKPVVSTECGYRYSGDQLVSEKAGATYLPRLLAEFFRRGFFRSFQYELLGSEWGLLRDDLTERPAFTALKNMLTVLHDTGEAAPGSLDFTLKDAPPDVRRVLLRKSGGAFYLLLWREVPSWDVQGKKDLTPKPAALTLEVAQPAAKVQTYSPNESAGPRTAGENTASIPLTVGDALLIVRIE